MNKPRILIVEDEMVVALDVEGRLRALGYDVVEVVDEAEAAVAAVERERPDLVLMDIRLKGARDGIDTALELRRRWDQSVVFLTAHADEATVQRAKECEPFGYILKPFEDRELRTVLEMAIYKQRTDAELRRLNRLYEVLSLVNRAQIEARSRPNFFEEVCRIAVEVAQFKLAWIGRYQELTGIIEAVASWGVGDHAACPTIAVPEGATSAACPCAQAVRREGPVVGPLPVPMQPPAACCRAAVAAGMREMGAIPIRVDSRVWGVFSVYTERTGVLGAKELALLHEVAGAIGAALERLDREDARRLAEEAVQAQKQLFETLLEVIPAPIYLKDPAGRYLRCNEAFAALAGRRREVLMHCAADEVSPAEDARAERAADDALFRQGRGGKQCYEGGVTAPDGSRRTVVFHKAVYCNVAGVPGGIVGVMLDITDLKEREAALRRSEARFRLLFESVLDGILVMTVEDDGRPGRILEANQALGRLTGFERSELLGRDAAELQSPDGEPLFGASLRRILSTGRDAFEALVRHRDGRAVPVEVNARMLEFEGRAAVMALVRDISPRRELEARFLHSQKLEAVGQLAGGIAHDFNNILAAMFMNLALVRAPGRSDTDPSEAVREIERLAHRAADLTRQLLLFGRRQALRLTRLDLDELIAGLVRMLQRVLGETIDITLTRAPAPQWVDADPGMLEQVIVNLAVNARDAMPRGGRLELAVDTVERPPAGGPSLGPGPRSVQRFVRLRVTDTGCGMDAETQRRIFEPFFTTKGRGQGTGLGLASVHGIVEQHQGWVEVESTIDVGTTFLVYLPAREPGPVAAPAEPHRTEPTPGGTETILLVEDSANVRRMAAMTLRSYGYAVIEAGQAQEAIQRWSQDPGAIDLVLTDMVMPGGTSGLELIQHLRRTRPRVKAIITSGYSLDLARGDRAQLDLVFYLAKPYQSDALARTVRQALDTR